MAEPSTIDFRALCAELLHPLAEYDGANPYHEHRALIARARAALAAEPVGEGPSDQELILTYAHAVAAAIDAHPGAFNQEDAQAAQLAGLRAALARWGRPATPPAPDAGEEPVGEGPGDAMQRLLAAPMDSRGYVGLRRPGSAGGGEVSNDIRDMIHRMADELDHLKQLLRDSRERHPLAAEARAVLAEPEPEPQPIPVSERLPGDALSWWYEPDEDDDPTGYGGNWTLLRIRGNVSVYTHWLPAHAIPLPQAGEGEV